jgi:hypothetical protein
MAHPCILCGEECYCHADFDDVIVSKTPSDCISCDRCIEIEEELEDDWRDLYEPEQYDDNEKNSEP